LASFYHENGLFLYLRRFADSLKTKLFNVFISGHIKHSGKIKIHHTAQLIGLGHFRIGRNFKTGRHFRMEAITKYCGQNFDPKIIIGDNVGAVDFVQIAATHHVEIGDNVMLASRVYISDHNHGIYKGDRQSAPDTPPGERVLDFSKKVIIGDNVWIGQQVTVLPGVSIGKGCVIGAHSVVTKDLPADSLAAGIPAKVLKRFDTTLKQWVSV